MATALQTNKFISRCTPEQRKYPQSRGPERWILRSIGAGARDAPRHQGVRVASQRLPQGCPRIFRNAPVYLWMAGCVRTFPGSGMVPDLVDSSHCTPKQRKHNKHRGRKSKVFGWPTPRCAARTPSPRAFRGDHKILTDAEAGRMLPDISGIHQGLVQLQLQTSNVARSLRCLGWTASGLLSHLYRGCGWGWRGVRGGGPRTVGVAPSPEKSVGAQNIPCSQMPSSA